MPRHSTISKPDKGTYSWMMLSTALRKEGEGNVSGNVYLRSKRP